MTTTEDPAPTASAVPAMPAATPQQSSVLVVDDSRMMRLALIQIGRAHV